MDQSIHKEKSREILRKIFLILFIIYFVGLLIHLFDIIVSSGSDTDYYVKKLDQGWSVNVAGKQYNDVDLDDFLPDKTLKRGDLVTLTTTLPQNVPNPSVLRLNMYLTTVDVYVYNKWVYSYGSGLYNAGRFVGSGIHFVYLPDNSGGKTITIELKAAEDNAFTNIPAPYVCYSTTGFVEYFRSNVGTVLSGVFLLLLGVLLTIPCLIIELRFNNTHRLVLIGLFSFTIGIWTTAYSRGLQLFSVDLTVNSVMEYCGLYFAPLPFLLLVGVSMKEVGGWRLRVINVLITVMAIFPATAIILHVTGIKHLPFMISYFHIAAVLGIIIVLVVTFSIRHKISPETKCLNVGLLFMLIFAVLDILRFNVQKYFWPSSEALSISILPLGVVIFVIMLIMSYLVYIYDILKERAEHDMLKSMAYHDNLTGLYNRAKFDEIMLELDGRKKNYCLIDFDLNGLKKTNDTYGHAAGDRLIKSFADCLVKIFGNLGGTDIMRIGGDEFIVISDIVSVEKIKKLLLSLENEEKKVSRETKLNLDASYGYCFSSEVEGKGPEEAYRIADNLMYEMKRSKEKTK